LPESTRDTRCGARTRRRGGATPGGGREIRREINAHGGAERRRRAGVEACFVLGMRRRHDPTSPFNVRAWLYFEA